MFQHMFRKQRTENSCGPAALSTLLKRFGVLASEEQIIRKLGSKLGPTGTSLAHLREICDGLGVKTASLEVMPGALDQLPFPCLAHLRMGHFVVLERITNDLVELTDPSIGPLRLHISEFFKSWSGVVLVVKERRPIIPADSLEHKLEMKASAGRFYRMVRLLAPYRWWVTGVGFLLLLNATIAVALPVALMLFIDRIVQNADVQTLGKLVGILGSITLVQALLRFGSNIAYNMVANGVLFDMRSNFLRQVQKFELEDISRINTGDLLSRLMNDAHVVQEFLTNFGFGVVVNTITIVVLIVVAFSMDPHLSVIGLSSLPLFAVVFWWLFLKLQRRSKTLHEQNALVMGQAQRVLTGLESIKAYGRDDVELDLFRTRQLQAWQAAFRVDVVQQSAGALAILLSSIGPILVLWYGGISVLNGGLTLGVLVGINVLISRLFDPVLQLAQQQSQWQVAVTAANRFFEIIDLKPSVAEAPEPIPLPTVSGMIQMDSVTVNYGNGNVLEDVSLEIQAGSIVSLIGPNGGGKSTLVQLIMRFVDPTKGSVRIDGRDAKSVSLKSLRSQTALVNQFALIFDGSVLDNIRYGRLHASRDEIIAAAVASGFHDVVSAMPEGYETKLTRNAGGLSAGQRQKLALARALLREPTILILDEATSSMDVQAEEALYRRLRAFLPRATIVIVAHRPWVTAQGAQLFYVDGGRILARGSHKELLKQCAPYHRMCEIAGMVAPVVPGFQVAANGRLAKHGR